jgi:hypothetical protein
MKNRSVKLFETLEDRRLYSVADFTIDTAASSIAVSGTIGNHPILEQRPGSLTAWLQGTIKADVVPGSIRLTGGSSITADERYEYVEPNDGTASLAGWVQNVSVFGSLTDAYFALRDAQFDITSPTLPVVNGQFDSAQVTTIGTNGTLEFEAGTFIGGVPLAQRSIVSPTLVPSGLFSSHGRAQLALCVDFTFTQDVPGNGTATIHAAGWIFAYAQRLGGVAGNIYNDANDNDLRDEGTVNPPTGAFTVYADVNRNGRLDAGEPSATPNARGDYQLEYVPFGDQPIRLQAPAGYRYTAPTSGALLVNVIGNGNVTGQNFLVTRKSAVSGVVWADANRNGRIDSTETRWSGRRVFDDLDGNGVYSIGEPSTLTNFKGAYVLRNLSAGTHRIRVELPKGNIVTTPIAGYASVKLYDGQVANDVNLGTGLDTLRVWSVVKPMFG